MNRRLVSIVLSLMLVVSMLLVIPSTASAVDSGEMALTDSVEVTVHKGDTVNYWVEVTIPQDSIDVAGWTVDMYYDNAMFDLNTDFADGYGFASGTKAIDYALGLSNEEVSFPGGSITQGTLRPELGRASVSDANPRGLKFRGNTTKVVCLQLKAIANGTTDLAYRMRDIADTNLELSFIEKPSYQPAGGAEFALKHIIICDHEDIVDPTEPATEPETDPVTEPATEPTTEAPTEPATEPVTEPETTPATDPATEPATEDVTDAPVKHTYTVAGTPGLCGSSWDVTDTNNDMAEISDGIFQKVYTNVNEGPIEFKVAEDYSWDNSFGPEGNEPGSANCVDEVLADGATVTITFDTKEGVVTWMIEYPEEPTEEPTDAPTELPTEAPTSEPTVAPTEVPTSEPTVAPTETPTSEPTAAPTEAPTSEPTVAPTEAPTSVATDKPTTPTSATNATTATNATSAITGSTSSSNATNTTTTTGKVATGDASSVAMLLGMLMIAAGTVISARRKFTSK